MNVRHRALINQPCVYFCLLMAAVANPSYFNAFHLVLLMTVFHKTWQLLTCLFLLEIYPLHLPSIYTHTYFPRPLNEGLENATNSLIHNFTPLFLLPKLDYKHFSHLYIFLQLLCYSLQYYSTADIRDSCMINCQYFSSFLSHFG